MCFPFAAPIIVGALTSLGSLMTSGLQARAQNKAAMANYQNELARQKLVNQSAIAQYNETASRLRVNRSREASNAFQQAQALIAENQKRMAAARASAGSSGMMGLPLNIMDQSFMSAIGGISSNLQNTYMGLDQNLFFDQSSARLNAQNVMNQAVPNRPQLTGLGFGHMAGAALSGLSAGLYVGSRGTGGSSTALQSQEALGLPTPMDYIIKD